MYQQLKGAACDQISVRRPKVEVVQQGSIVDQTLRLIFCSLSPTHSNQLRPNFQSHTAKLTRLPGVAGSVLRGENVSIVGIIVLFKCMNNCAAAGASLSFIQRTFQVFEGGADGHVRLQSDERLQWVGGYSYFTPMKKIRGGLRLKTLWRETDLRCSWLICILPNILSVNKVAGWGRHVPQRQIRKLISLSQAF